MAATKGNRFWELRSKHGRDKLFKTPKLMWEAACEYFEWCEDTPLMGCEVVKSGKEAGQLLKVPKMRAFTLTGLCLYLECSASYFRSFKSTLQEKDKDFLTVINKIEDVIYNQKFEGAAADLLNANIIARDLGLKDHSEATVQIEQGVFKIGNQEIQF